MGVSINVAFIGMISTFMNLWQVSLQLSLCLPCVVFPSICFQLEVQERPNSVVKQLQKFIRQIFLTLLRQSQGSCPAVSFIPTQNNFCIPFCGTIKVNFTQLSAFTQAGFLITVSVNRFHYLVQSVKVSALPNSEQVW